MVFIGRQGLDDQLYIGGNSEQFGNHVRGPGQKAPLKKNNVGGKALDRQPEIFERVSLGYDAQIVFKRKDLANPDAVNRLGIRKDDANRSRFNWCVENLVLSRIFQEVHSGLPKLPGSHCSANLYSSIVAAARYCVLLKQQRTTRPRQ